MTKQTRRSLFGVLLGVFIFLLSSILWAGDTAHFEDLGFSPDGRTYIFGQYGRTEGSLQGYAEIYTVDVAKNDFLPGGVFRIGPDASTSQKSSLAVWDNLKSANQSFLNRYNTRLVGFDQMVYLRAPNDTGKSAVSFQDFENTTLKGKGTRYEIRIESYIEGSGQSVRSSFYIVMETYNRNGTFIERKVIGNPDIKRKGVSGYTFEKIFADKSGKSLVFVIAKNMIDPSGASIRYMVETTLLD